MDKPPLVSIVVPVYNIERYVGSCIQSLICQDYRDIEIVLVDDGSSDRSSEICDIYARKDSRIKVIHKQNRGLVSARKAGLELAAGEYIGYVDGDDWIEQDFYSALISAAVGTDSDIVIAGQKRDFLGQTKRFSNMYPAGIYDHEKLEDLYGNMLSSGPFHNLGVFTYLWNKLFKRDIIFDAQMSVDDRISIGEDAACFYPAMLASRRVCIIENVSYHYRQREDSMLKRSAPVMTELPTIKRLYDYMVQQMCPSSDPNQYKLHRQISDYILSILIIRSGGLIPNQSDFSRVFPFGASIKNKRVAIYSAGTFGQQLRRRLEEAEHCTVVGWVDYDYWEYRRCCLDVDPVEELGCMDVDYYLVASVNSQLSEGVKEKLVGLGINKSKILTVKIAAEDRSTAINEYFAALTGFSE